MSLQSRGRIDIGGRTGFVGKLHEIDIFGMQPAATIGEMIHREIGPGGWERSAAINVATAVEVGATDYSRL
ncbi:MAG TPA: hypothetical protein VG274_05375 [Rhizomicrobium sp.]|nr:hypothetical protein [Rhizomicrobium sp.]